jgi:hypothetical protein
MKTFKSVIALALIAAIEFSPIASAQNTVMRGEMNQSGKYVNIMVDSTGKLIVTNASNNQPVTVTNVPLPITAPDPIPVTGIVTGNVGVTGVVSILNDVNTVERNYLYKNITGNGTTIIRAGSGKLKRITVNTPGTLSQMTIYDSATGTGTKIGTANTVLGQVSLQYDIAFNTGLTIVTTGTLSADLTVVYW